MSIEKFGLYAIKNKEYIAGNKVGCYHCLEIFQGDTVKAWTDGGLTAICPGCNVDALVSEVQHEINEDILVKAKKYWIGESND